MRLIGHASDEKKKPTEAFLRRLSGDCLHSIPQLILAIASEKLVGVLLRNLAAARPALQPGTKGGVRLRSRSLNIVHIETFLST